MCTLAYESIIVDMARFTWLRMLTKMQAIKNLMNEELGKIRWIRQPFQGQVYRLEVNPDELKKKSIENDRDFFVGSLLRQEYLTYKKSKSVYWKKRKEYKEKENGTDRIIKKYGRTYRRFKRNQIGCRCLHRWNADCSTACVQCQRINSRCSM